ncbi:sulfotransferase [Crocosphaera sp. Alani8]|uniref:sulfotransferase n=1 Tax=Crocosphaera sp. Alani8 TaxID=3038952 RepID=UPI00313A9832
MTEITLNTPPYVLIVGHGRSGTNWLLDILDASEKTHCRNEPDAVSNSQLEYVRTLWSSKDSLEEVLRQWETRINKAKLCMSERDHHIETPKQHIYPLSHKSGIATLPTRRKIRQALRLVMPQFRQGEWQVPWWIADETKLEQACGVFKINRLAAWFVHPLAVNYPQIPILHIVRHPGGYLNSALKRFFVSCSTEELNKEFELYQMIMKTAIQVYPEWQERVGDLSSMDLTETVMWFWCLNNEMIYEENKNNPNYHLLIYENIVANPLEQSQKVYDFCRLPWNEVVESQIKEGLTESVWGSLKSKPSAVAQAWRKSLTVEHQSLVSKILSTSRIEFLWSDSADI